MGFVFDKCCGCIELKTGCLIIGYLQLIGEIIATILLFMVVTAGGVLASQTTDEEKAAGYIMLIIAGIMLFFIILAMAFTITLLVGLHKDKRGHIKAYLIYACIFFVIGLIAFFASFASKPLYIGNIISNLITILINLYFLLVIRSHYLVLGDNSKGPAIYHTA